MSELVIGDAMPDDLAAAEARREFVPSSREVDLGQTDYEFRPAPVVAASDAQTKDALKQGLRDLDPRNLGAPLRPMVVFAALFMITGFDVSAFSVLAADIKTSFHADIGLLVALSTIVGVVTTIVAPFSGYLADRVSRVRLLAFGSALTSIAQIGAGAAPTVRDLAGARALGGLGGGLTQPVVLPLLTDYYPVRSRARSFSLVFVATGVGATLGPVVAGELGNTLGWRATFELLGVISLAIALSVLFLREPKRGVQDRLALDVDPEVAQTEQRPVSWAEGWRAAASIASLRRIWYMTPFLAVAGSLLAPVYSLYYATNFGIGSSGRGVIFGIQGAFGMAGLALAGPIADKVLSTRPGRVFTLAAGLMVLNAVVMITLVLSPWLWLSVGIQLPVAAVGDMVLPTLLSVVSMVVPARLRGFGLQTTAPFQLMGFLAVEAIFLAAPGLGMAQSLLLTAVIFVMGAAVTAAGAPGVERDMRAARAASIAEEASREARLAGRDKILVCRDVDVTYEGTQVLFGLNFDLHVGEIVALLGTNGAGKSTLLRAIAGLQEASNGAIFYGGHDITHRPPHLNAQDGIVFVPGGAAVFPGLAVIDNLRSAGWLQRSSADALDKRIEEVLGLFPELRDRLDVQAGLLSGGEQQMVALGQAFVMRPTLLMIDELSLGLAPAVVERLLEIVRRINKAGTTIVLVEQSANVAMTIASRAVFMDKGEVRFDGSTEELLSRSDLLRAVFLAGTGATAAGFVASGRPAPPTAAGPVLEARDIEISYGGRQVLHGLTLSVDAGEVLGVIGPNGAGKTTLFDVLSGYVAPSAGSVWIDGTDCTRLSPDARAKIGLARSFQHARLFPSMTVRENVAVAFERKLAVRSAIAGALWLPPLRRAERRIARRVDYLLDLLHLGAFADKFVRELSTGSRRMVDVACVMALEPAALLLDEPSSGLAQSEVEVLGPVIRRLSKETGCGVIVIEHDIPLVTSLADRLIALRLGEVVCQGAPADVVANPEVISAYLGANTSAIGRSGAVVQSVLAATAAPG